jgi:hypothetical protein
MGGTSQEDNVIAHAASPGISKRRHFVTTAPRALGKRSTFERSIRSVFYAHPTSTIQERHTPIIKTQYIYNARHRTLIPPPGIPLRGLCCWEHQPLPRMVTARVRLSSCCRARTTQDMQQLQLARGRILVEPADNWRDAIIRNPLNLHFVWNRFSPRSLDTQVISIQDLHEGVNDLADCSHKAILVIDEPEVSTVPTGRSDECEDSGGPFNWCVLRAAARIFSHLFHSDQCLVRINL